MGAGVFKELFPRLYLLSSQPKATIKEMGRWREGVWLWEFNWLRQLLQRETESVNELLQLISCFSPATVRCDEWCWTKDGSGIYSVCSAYEFLQGRVESLAVDERVFTKLWAAKAPSNALALSWKILNNRIPTKVELARRNALPGGLNTTCVLCADSEESIAHLFLSCNISWRIWMQVYKWLGMSMVLTNSVSQHFLHHVIPGINGRGSKAASLIWVATVGVIWNLRNGVVFRGVSVDTARILDSIQFRTWLWLKANNSSFGVSVYEWIENPRVCLEML